MLLLLQQREKRNTQLEQGAAPVGAALLQSNRDTKPILKIESLSNPNRLKQPNIFLLST